MNAPLTPDAPAQIQQPPSWLDSATAKVAGVGIAVAATYVTGRDAISRAFFKTVNKGDEGAFADLQREREIANAKVHEPARLSKFVHVSDAPEKIGAISREYDRQLRIRKAQLGFTNVFKEAKVLKKHQWWEVAFATSAVAIGAVGALIAISSSRDTVRKEDSLTKDIEQGGRGI